MYKYYFYKTVAFPVRNIATFTEKFVVVLLVKPLTNRSGHGAQFWIEVNIMLTICSIYVLYESEWEKIKGNRKKKMHVCYLFYLF